MSNKLIATAVAAGVAGAVVAGVCVSAGSASAAGDRAVLHYTLSKSGAVGGAGHTAPGFAKFHITGAKGQNFQLVRPRHAGVTKAKVVSDAAAVNQGNPKPFEADLTSIGGSPTGTKLFVTLKRGTYYAADTSTKTLTAAHIKTIHVSGAVKNAAHPKLGGTVRSVGDMMWSSKPARIASSGYLRFQNRSKKDLNNTHFVELDKLKKGKTRADLTKVFKGKESPKAVFATGKHTSYTTGVITHGRTQVSSYTLRPGKYMLACFFPDRTTGQPHAFMGMYRTINVG